ncbi:hypothetical protein ASE49_05495 [Novosphingobium sp. Leaf2]|nr:hypothetical protein ASE49_05495 [Novosphingobium sp. Leaf2]
MRRGRIGKVAIVTVLTAIVFAIDTGTDLEIATPVFYIMVILIAVGMFSRREVIRLAVVCMVLTVFSATLTRTGSQEAGVINSGISIAAIAITTWLALRVVSAESAAYETRAQLIRIARVNSLGELAASIAHEVNQPLSAIATSGNACLRWLGADPPNLDRARLAATRIVEDANRASGIVGRIRQQVRGKGPRKTKTALNAVVLDALALAQGEMARHGTVVRTDLAPDLPMILGDRIQLQQVLGNLILNAIEASAGLPPARRVITLSTGVARGMVHLRVKDEGIGVPEQDLPLLFDAFWTTKDGGTGMGLAICRTIVEAHGGAMNVALPEPCGLEVTVSLPVRAKS